MTDNEIIKALERCANDDLCNDCGFVYGDCNCGRYRICLIQDTLSLINRQKAEIERLNKKVEELSEVLSDTIRIRYAECRAEAIKEFAERLKAKFDKYGVDYTAYTMGDDIVREMGVNSDAD